MLGLIENNEEQKETPGENRQYKINLPNLRRLFFSSPYVAVVAIELESEGLSTRYMDVFIKFC